MIESFRLIASSATAFVRSIVNNAEGLNWPGRYGASSSTVEFVRAYDFGDLTWYDWSLCHLDKTNFCHWDLEKRVEKTDSRCCRNSCLLTLLDTAYVPHQQQPVESLSLCLHVTIMFLSVPTWANGEARVSETILDRDLCRNLCEFIALLELKLDPVFKSNLSSKNIIPYYLWFL